MYKTLFRAALAALVTLAAQVSSLSKQLSDASATSAAPSPEADVDTQEAAVQLNNWLTENGFPVSESQPAMSPQAQSSVPLPNNLPPVPLPNNLPPPRVMTADEAAAAAGQV